jgi:hypothetical protein
MKLSGDEGSNAAAASTARNSAAWRTIAWKLCLVACLSAALLTTYNKCIVCVLAVAVFSALTMNCVPLMPLVFVLSIAVLLMHAVDYDKATIRLEVPLQDIVYIPTWKDVQEYVHVVPPPAAAGT